MTQSFLTFTKMHGAANDYVYLNAFDQQLPENLADLAVSMSDRHRGVGGDGIVAICPSETADAWMRMFNADGSEAEMCGNAVRCVAKYVNDYIKPGQTELTIQTGAGDLPIQLMFEDGECTGAVVDMGKPILTSAQIPTLLPGDPPVNASLEVADKQLDVTAVSMGNPHCVTFVEQLSDDWVHRVGPLVEVHSQFPNRINAEFVEIVSPEEVHMRVWERGSGETQACGTGACAVTVAGVLTGKLSRKVLVHLPGGDLIIEWDEKTDHVMMTGPAEEVFKGQWPLS